MEKEPTFTNKENQPETLEPVLASIVTAEQYSHTEHTTPYIFELQGEDKELRYFGSPHVRDPKNPLFGEIEAAFNEANPDIVFVEGVNVHGDRDEFNERVKAATREEAIEHMGESGFTLKLGIDKGIEWRSPEPTDEDLYNDLLAKGFSKDQIFVWDVFHILPQYNRLMNKKRFKEYIESFIDRFKQSTNWEGFDYSYERAIQLGEQILGRSVDVENEPDAPDFIDPIPWEDKKNTQTILNRIGEASSLFRDRQIVRDIADALKTYKRVFVVYGASHAVMQEPALRKLMENPESEYGRMNQENKDASIKFSLKDLTEKVSIEIFPTTIDDLCRKENLEREALEDEVQKRSLKVIEELSQITSTNHASDDLQFLGLLYGALQKSNEEEESSLHGLREKFATYEVFKANFLKSLPPEYERILWGWINTTWHKLNPSGLIRININKSDKMFTKKFPELASLTAKKNVEEKETVYADANEVEADQWIKIQDIGDWEVYIKTEVQEEIERLRSELAPGSLRGLVYHSTSSAALAGIGKHKALLSRSMLAKRNEKALSGERSDFLPGVYAYGSLVGTQSYAAVSWFDEYPITFGIDESEEVKLLQDKYPPDHGISFGDELPLQHTALLIAPHRNMSALEQWKNEHAPKARIISSEAAWVLGL